MKSKQIIVSLVLSLLLLLLATPVYAIPSLPHAFQGSVEINGSPAPDGSQVSAVVSDSSVIASQNPVTASGGSYGVDSPKLLVQGDIPNGAIIQFYVDGVDTGITATYESGGGPTTVDLAVTIVEPEPEPEPVPPIGGVGGGGAGATDINRVSADGDLSVSVPAGTVVRNASGSIIPSYRVQVSPMTDSPLPPEDSNIIGMAYDLQPSGTTFNPPIPLTFTYDPTQIPEGVSESDLVIAFWGGSQWVGLEGVVDVATHTVTAQVSHFTVFAMLVTVVPATEEPAPVPVAPEPQTPEEPDVVITIPPVVTPGTPDVAIPAPSVPSQPKPAPLPPSPAPLPPEPEPSGLPFWGYLAILAGLVVVCSIWWYKRRVSD